ncbi:MAG: hypothetical protein FWC57_02205 [Endomicrobia bacterium]|nr:hypothetical protein [Endomicrobiia bacterium]
MKRFTVFAAAAFFVASLGLSAFAQESSSGDEQAAKDKAAAEAAYKEQKADLDMQLRKLEKDLGSAKRDQNTALVNKRNDDISNTKKRIKDLEEQHNGTPAGDKKKDSEVKDKDFYAKELAAEEAKMKAEDEAVNRPEKKPAKKSAKKGAAKKKAQKKDDDEIIIPHDEDTVGDLSGNGQEGAQNQEQENN